MRRSSNRIKRGKDSDSNGALIGVTVATKEHGPIEAAAAAAAGVGEGVGIEVVVFVIAQQAMFISVERGNVLDIALSRK